jgi:uncharacterized protein YxeA
MKKLIIALVCIVYAISASGCIAAAFVGGAAGGGYFAKNYDVTKKEDDSANTDQTDGTDQQTDAN